MLLTGVVERDTLVEAIAARIATLRLPHPIRVAIDGVDASGKTTLANELAPALETLGRRVIRASIDGFHHPDAVRKRRGAMSPEGYFHDSFDHAAVIEHLLAPLGPGGSLRFRRAVFDFRTNAPIQSPVEQAHTDAVLVFDGVFLLRPELREYFDFSIFLRVDFGITLARAERRDLPLFGSVEEIRRRYGERYVPGQRLYLRQVQPERLASIVIDNNDPGRPIVVRSV
jgi:uridine kinase